METMTRALVLFTILSLAGVSDVQAQGADLPRVLLNVNVGLQAHTHSLTVEDSFTVYAETATVSASKAVSGGSLVDAGLGFRMRDNLAIGVGVSRVRKGGDGVMNARIPHPFLFDRFADRTETLEGLDRLEVGIHIQAMWFLPVEAYLPEGMRLAIVAGPSIFRVKHDLITTATVPAGTQNAVAVVDSGKGTGVGFNGGFDVSYPVTSRVGIGGLVRYSGGSADLTADDGATLVEGARAGGFHAAGGVRLGF
jgi:hypothetical protein